MEQLLFLLIVFALMWFLLIRPQQQRIRQQREFLASIVVGDRVVTAGGIIGTIVRLDGDEARVQVTEGIVLTFVRPAISRRYEPTVIDGTAEGEG